MEIPYKRSEWVLCLQPRHLRHALGILFEVAEDLKTARFVSAEQDVLEDDCDALEKTAVTAYLDLIGWMEPYRDNNPLVARRLGGGKRQPN
jgi:hypothetical protein